MPDAQTKNLIICVSGSPIKKNFSILITDIIQDLHLMENSQSFPMYFYEKAESNEPATGAWYGEETVQPEYTRKEAITDQALTEFRKIYGQEVTKEDIFYYIYAVLQSKGYISAYQDNLSKEMPRIPFLKGFSEYVRIGKALADIHLHYEEPVNPEEIGVTVEIDKPDYTVQQMKFLKDGKKALKDTSSSMNISASATFRSVCMITSLTANPLLSGLWSVMPSLPTRQAESQTTRTITAMRSISLICFSL